MAVTTDSLRSFTGFETRPRRCNRPPRQWGHCSGRPSGRVLTWGSRNLILDIAGFLKAIGLSLHSLSGSPALFIPTFYETITGIWRLSAFQFCFHLDERRRTKDEWFVLCLSSFVG